MTRSAQAGPLDAPPEIWTRHPSELTRYLRPVIMIRTEYTMPVNIA
jgi:hypothetical protein